MGCPAAVGLNGSLVFSIDTHNPTTSAAIDADALPTYRVYKNETSAAISTGTMAKLDDANTTGFYSKTLACTPANGYEDGKTYTIYIAAIVGGITGTISYGFTVQGVVDQVGTGGSPSEVAICNLALLALGASPIVALSGGKIETACALLYPQCRDEVLDLVKPNFAIVPASLAQLVTAPLSGYAYAYQLPTDCIRARGIGALAGPWAREGSTLVTDESSVVLRYIARITDTTAYTPLFTLALVAYLAARLTYAITKFASMKERMLGEYEKALAEALSAEGAEGTPVTMSSTILTTSVRT